MNLLRNRLAAFVLMSAIGLDNSTHASGLVGFQPPPQAPSSGHIGNARLLSPGEGVPKGWLLAGKGVDRYWVGTGYGEGAPFGQRFASLGSSLTAISRQIHPSIEIPQSDNSAKLPPFATLMQSFRADAYHGKRMHLSALLQATNVSQAAALWMRVEAQNGKVLAFDNMEGHQLKGSTPWQRCDIVLDVPEEGATIAAGFLLAGSGGVRAADFRFEPVDTSVAVTAPAVRAPEQTLPDAPVNLHFDL